MVGNVPSTACGYATWCLQLGAAASRAPCETLPNAGCHGSLLSTTYAHCRADALKMPLRETCAIFDTQTSVRKANVHNHALRDLQQTIESRQADIEQALHAEGKVETTYAHANTGQVSCRDDEALTTG